MILLAARRPLRQPMTRRWRTSLSRPRATPSEHALVEALPIRHPQREITGDVDEMPAWDVAFTAAMQKVAAEYPGDLDIKSVFVEAIMNKTPWQMWDLDTGKIADGAGTAEARAVLEGAFETIPACCISMST